MNLKTGLNRPVQSQAVNWANARLLADLRALPAARRRPKAGGKLRLQHPGIFERPGEEARRRLGVGPNNNNTAALDLGEIMICGLDFPKYFLINSLITRSNF